VHRDEPWKDDEEVRPERARAGAAPGRAKPCWGADETVTTVRTPPKRIIVERMCAKRRPSLRIA